MTILVLGSRGLVGSAICRELDKLQKQYVPATREIVDITNRSQVFSLFRELRPNTVFAAAAKVGGLKANYDYPVEFLSENVISQTYLMEAAHAYDVEKFVFLGSSCIYPREASQPISEKALLTGPLETTNEAYAIAKIAGVKLIQGYRREYGKKWISVMPTNLYGINDNFDLSTSHALPALLRKFHEAKIKEKSHVELWGSGKPRREFMFSDDFASALLFTADRYDSDELINIGTGEDISIFELSVMIQEIVEFEGEVVWNSSVPDGTFRKLLDTTKLNNLGWRHTKTLREGLEITYSWFKDNYDSARLSVDIKS